MTVFAGPPLEDLAEVASITMAGFVPDVASRYRTHEAIVFDDPLCGQTTRWSYDDLGYHTRDIARALLVDGVAPSTRVGILMGNRPEAVAAIFGTATAGAVPVLLSTFATPVELAGMLRAAHVEILLTQARLLKRDFPAEIAALRGDVELLRSVIAFGTKSWDFWLASANEPTTDERIAERVLSISPDDDGLIYFSSGTTSAPKGIVHSQRGPALACRLQGSIFGRSTETRMWSPLPIFWSAGFNSAVGATLAMGGTCVLQETFDAAAALALIAREAVTEPYALPHQNRALAEHPDWESTDLSSLRQVYGKSVYARHPKVDGDPDWNMPVGYGMSETCALFAAHPSTTPRAELKASYGTLLAGNELRVVDPDTGDDLDTDTVGELCVRGPSLLTHYLGKAREESLDEDGFLHTGDLGSFDAAGHLHFEGRGTEMIKTAGANVAPAEIEVQLQAHPAVKVSRVIGMPDPARGEIVVACITLQSWATTTINEITEFLRERIAAYKVPSVVMFFDDGDIPMTAAGSKVRDPELARVVAERLAAQPSVSPGPETGTVTESASGAS